MRRTLLAPLVVAALAPWAAADDKKPDLFPLTKGTRWEYWMMLGGEAASVWPLPVARCTVEVARAADEKEKGRTAVLTCTTAGMDPTEQVVTLDAEGVATNWLLPPFERQEKPVTVLKLPPAAGTKWASTMSVGGKAREAKYEVRAAEKVTPLGVEYKAYPVKAALRGDEDRAMTVTTWYADGVGIVKQEVAEDGRMGSLVWLLNKYTPAK